MGRIAARNHHRTIAKKLRPPKSVELRYVGALTGAMRAMHGKAMKWLEPRLSEIADGSRGDAMTPLGRDFEDEVDDLIAALASSVTPAFTKLSTSVAQNNMRAMKSLGLDVRESLGATIEHLRDWNVRLMKNAGQAYADDVADVLSDPENWGISLEALTQKILDRADVSESRAELIARDQTQKMNASINKTRQQHAGISQFVWSTSLDERVRDSHAENEGETFDWTNPPAETGLPGDDVNCRCVAVPVLPGEGEEEEGDEEDLAAE